jgi:hypothetical protein
MISKLATNGNVATENHGFGDLAVIRNILMGEQISKIDQVLALQNNQIEALLSKAAQQEEQFLSLLQALETKVNEKLAGIEEKMTLTDVHLSQNLQTAIGQERTEISSLFRIMAEQLSK